MISELVSTATRLREVREAQDLFLSLWAMERMASTPEALDRVAEDVARSGYSGHAGPDAFHEIADGRHLPPALLQRRGVLDD